MRRRAAYGTTQPRRDSHGENGTLAKSQDLRHSFRLTPNQVTIGTYLIIQTAGVTDGMAAVAWQATSEEPN